MTTPDRALLWRRCALLGRILLPMVDQEPWRQARRHDNLRAWGIGVAEGERLIEVFAALAACAAAEDAALSAAELDGLSLHAVADAATGKADIELLVGLPDTFDDPRDEEAAGFFRLYSYQGGTGSPASVPAQQGSATRSSGHRRSFKTHVCDLRQLLPASSPRWCLPRAMNPA
ncbi:hypothetical protein [Streptomyces hydrogenans]|uniref:hypothetical protein n=1 Tax=Streptomyces hydrogenans TaxID=1873719 RepID=UPI0035DCD14F